MTSMQPLKIVIFGPYKSGTTGLYTKIANSLPEPFDSVFEQRTYTPEGSDAGHWVLAKTIVWYEGRADAEAYRDFLGFDRKIFLVRDPRDWLVSATLFIIQQEPSLYAVDQRMAKILAALRAKEERPRGQSLLELLELILGLSDHHDFGDEIDWMRHQYRWLPQLERDIGDHLVVRYEDFVEGRLADLETYLGLPLTGSDQVAPAFDHVPRTRGHGNWRHWLTDSDVETLKPIFQDYMRLYQYPDDWTLAPQPLIASEHCTRYVIRTVNKRRATPLRWP